MKRLLSFLAALILALTPTAAYAAAEVVVVPAPYDVVRGDPVVIGVLTGIAANDAATGAQIRLRREGVFTVAKVSGTAWSRGDALFFASGDAGLSKIDTKTFFGIAASDALSGATTGSVIVVPSGPIGSLEGALDTLTATVAGFATTFTTGNLTASNVTVDDTLVAGNATIASVDFASFWDEMMAFETSAGGRLDALEAGAGGEIDALVLSEQFGDGSDGNLTCSSSSITSGPISAGALTRAAYYESITVQSGCQINANGFPVYVRSQADLTAAPAAWLVEPTPAAAGNGANYAQSSGGAGGTATALALTVQDVIQQAAGTNGANGLCCSPTAGNQASGPASAVWLGYPGGTGAAGGTGYNGSAGGAARAPAVHATRKWLAPFRPVFHGVGSSLRPCASGAGGASGGGGGSGGPYYSGAGGGGGLCGYTLVFHAYDIATSASTASGMFRSIGGAGGSGGAGSPVAGQGGAGGGGGGGGGGMAEVAYWRRTGATVANAFSVTGGQGGLKGTTGAYGAASDGTGGHGGLVVVCDLQTGVCTNSLNTTPASGRTGGSTTASL